MRRIELFDYGGLWLSKQTAYIGTYSGGKKILCLRKSCEIAAVFFYIFIFKL